jgi:hypothetical protein
MLGTACGVTSRVASQFTSATARLTAASSASRRSAAAAHPGGRPAASRGLRQQAPARPREQQDAAHIQRQGEAACRLAQDFRRRKGELGRRSSWASPCRSGKADVPGVRRSPPFSPLPHARQLDRLARHLAFGQGLFLAIFRWRGGSDRGWQNPSGRRRRRILAQGLLDDAHGLDELRQSIAPRTRRLPMLLLIET